jgi:hypothetical protein
MAVVAAAAAAWEALVVAAAAPIQLLRSMGVQAALAVVVVAVQRAVRTLEVWVVLAVVAVGKMGALLQQPGLQEWVAAFPLPQHSLAEVEAALHLALPSLSIAVGDSRIEETEVYHKLPVALR